MSGAKHRQKGSRMERKVVNDLKELGLDAERVPLSGAAGGNYSGDVVVRLPDPQTGEPGAWLLVAECKARKNGAGFTTLERWLGALDILILKRDRQDPMVVLPWRVFARLIGGRHEAE